MLVHWTFQDGNQSGAYMQPHNPVLIDPLDKLAEIAASREVSVCDLIDAL